MKRNFWLTQLFPALFILALVITTAAWQGQAAKSVYVANDTVPDKKIKNIDEALEQLEKSKQEVERILKNKDWEREMKEALDKIHLDADKMKLEIADAIKDIDAKKIQMDIEKAVKDVDLVRIKTDLEQKLNKADLDGLKDEIEKAITDMDMEKIKVDISTSVTKIDLDKIRIEVDKINDIDFRKIEEDFKKIKPDIEKAMQDAKEGLDKAKTELSGYRNFINALEKDGLIETHKNYTIEFKNADLIINGKKQPADVVKKYSSFLNGRKNFTIKKDNDRFNIDNE